MSYLSAIPTITVFGFASHNDSDPGATKHFLHRYTNKQVYNIEWIMRILLISLSGGQFVKLCPACRLEPDR